MNGKLKMGGVEMAPEKVASNRGRRRGGSPSHPPKRVGLAKSRLLARLEGKEGDDEDADIIGDLAYRERKGGSAKVRKGLAFTFRDQT